MTLTKNASTKQSETNAIQNNDKQKTKTKFTRVVIYCDVGFNNSIFIHETS